MTERPALPPTHLPTLTEVIADQTADAGAPADQGALHVGVPMVAGEFVSSIHGSLEAPDGAAPPAPLLGGQRSGGSVADPAAAPVDLDLQLTQRVLADVQRQLDVTFEQRVRAALAPALARASQSLVEDLRGQLNDVLRDTVSLAVAQELARQRQRFRA